MSAKARLEARRKEMAIQEARRKQHEARRAAERAEDERIERIWAEKFEKQLRRYYA